MPWFYACPYYRRDHRRCRLENTWDLYEVVFADTLAIRTHKVVVFWHVCPACESRRQFESAAAHRKPQGLDALNTFLRRKLRYKSFGVCYSISRNECSSNKYLQEKVSGPIFPYVRPRHRYEEHTVDDQIGIASRTCVRFHANWLLPSPAILYTHSTMESPHEHQQTLLLSRIITNIEKLNEAVMMMNKSLQVCHESSNRDYRFLD
jgi:hypothetical protein